MNGGQSILTIPKAPLNFQQSIFFPLSSAEFKPPKILIKCYPYQKNEQDRLRSMDRAPKKFIVSPVDWKPAGQMIFYATEIQQMSLEAFIFLHKMKNISIEKQLLKSFVKTFDTLNKLHKAGLLHGNLKPSNIFITFPEAYTNQNSNSINTEEIEWKLAEVGINPKSQNKYYSKSRLIEDNGSKSMFADPKENDYYSLGVILLEMATLDPIEKVHNDIANDKLSEKQYIEKMKKSESKQHFLSTDLLDFIKALLNPKQLNSNVSKVGGLNTLYHIYADPSKDRQDNEATIKPYINYKEYFLTYETIETFFTNNTIESIIKRLKENISKEELKCSEVLKYINRELDQEEEFFFPTSEEFFKFVYKYGKSQSKRQDQDLFKKNVDSLLFSTFFTFESHIFYMPILMKLFKSVDLADTVLKKAIDRYESSTQFFKDQTNNKDAWKTEDMFNFFHSIRVPLAPDDIQSILRAWVPNSKENTAINSLKLDDFKKVFKDYSSPKKIQKMGDTDKKSKQKEEKILDMFKEISKNQDNLVHFFRRMPGQNKWEVPIDKVREQLKKYYKFKSAYEEKEIVSQLSAIGRLSQNDKTIDYVRVLRKIAIYEPLELFRKVLVQRINEDGIGNIYKKYEKDGNGWKMDSVHQFCQRQGLDFDQKHQNMFFNLLDKDDSGYINLKELTYKLTGIKEFDMEIIIETIKNAAKNDGDKVFDAFLKVDRQKMFALGNPDEIILAFELIDEQMRFETSHIQEIYNKFINRKGKFEYLNFIRYFCDLNHIFMKTCSILIDSMYNGEFEKFFKIGLKGDQRKWKRDSLSRVNDMLVLGFKEKQLDEVWKKIDSKDDNSLTIEEVGEKFNKHVESFEEFKGRQVESLTDYRPKRKEESRKSIIDDKNRLSSKNLLKSNQEDDLENNQLILDLKSMKLKPILVQSFKKAETASSVWIDSQKFCSILKDESISCTKKFLQSSFPYCLRKTSTKTLFNYLKFFLLVAQFKKDPLKEKTQCLRYVLTSFCKEKRIKANKVFEDFRVRDQMMKLSKFETVVKDILEVADEELFFEDINDVWIFFGDPQFINIKNLQRILEDEDSQRLRDFVRNQKDQKQGTGFDSRQRATPTLRSRHDSQYSKRKQSEDSTDLRKVNMIQREDKNQRNRNERSRKDSESQWRNSEMQRKRQDQERQKRDYERDRKQRERRREMEEERQRQRGRERERQRERQKERDRNAINRRRKDSESQRDSEREDDRKKKISANKRTSMEDNLFTRKEKQKQRNVSLSKKQLIFKLEKQLEHKSTDQLTRLFMDKNKIDKDQLVYCLTRYYDFGKKEAEDLSENLSDFGQVKIETVKKYLRPNQKQRQRVSSKDSPKKYGKQRQRTVEFIDQQQKKYGDQKIISPVTRQIKPQHRLSNPHKRKLNTPLIKEQIKMIIRSFSQKYAIEEIDKYFFDDSDIIYRDQFIKKCKGINTNLGEQNIEKIFEFLKPNQKDEVSIMNFKISFSFDQNVEVQEDYLPKDLVKELQEIFNAHDKDKSGSIQPSEVEALLASLGFNETQKQIENVFQKIDKNFDNQISFSEFKSFIEDFILPHLVEFQNDVDELYTMLKMNDIFNTGCVSLTVLLAIIERYGVKLTNQEGVFLAKYIGNQNDQIPIYDFLAALYYSSNPMFPPVVKSALYKIKLRRKISLKEIQKTFTNISSNFVMAYTSRLIKSEQLKRSTAFEPVLHQSCMFFQDFLYKDFRRIQSSKNDKVLVDNDPKSTTSFVEIRIPQAAGVPIPQNSTVKGAILKRAMNVSFFDMSAENAKHCIITLEAEWDSQIEDQWLFDMKNRSFYMKIANYDARKFEKMIVLFQLVITINDNGRIIDVSCGSASISVKELLSVENKFSKKLKLVSGIPTKAKEIDKVSVTKRSGWKSFLGSSNIESELSIDIIGQKNIDQKTIIPMLHAMPSICLVKRKSLHYIWAFREYFAERCVDRDCINPQFSNHHTVRSFLLSLNIDDISNQIVSFWRDKIEQIFINKRQNVKTVWQSRVVMYHLLTDLHMILNTKQFELKMSNPCASVAQNKNLFMLRQKMVNEVLENIENYVKNDLGKNLSYKRIKNYNYNYSPIGSEYGRNSLQNYINQNVIKIGKVS